MCLQKEPRAKREKTHAEKRGQRENNKTTSHRAKHAKHAKGTEGVRPCASVEKVQLDD